MIRKDGGTAFPMQDPQAIHAYAQAATEAANHDQVEDRDQTYLAARAEAIGGMSLRDYFAAKAMQALLTRMNSGPGNQAAAERMTRESAAYAYATADAMLAERAK